MTFVLLLMLNFPGKPESSMTNVPGFKSAQDCEAAGKAAKEAFAFPQLSYVCLKQ
jgi:TctA family transporter